MVDIAKIVEFLRNYKGMLAILTIILMLTAFAVTGITIRVGDEVVDIDTTANVQNSSGVNLSFYPHNFDHDHSRGVHYPNLNIQQPKEGV